MKKNQNRIIITFDGGARGNPGLSGCGATVNEIIIVGNNQVKVKIHGIISIYLGENTNNFAEYQGITEGIQLMMKIFEENNKILVIGDSQMILETLKKVKITNKYREEQEKIYEILQLQKDIKYKHHFRINNQVADYLANSAMDRGRNKNRIQNDLDGEKIKELLWNDLKEEYNVESIEIEEKVRYIENREDKKERD